MSKVSLTVSGVKSFKGMEGYGFNATLNVNGQPACLVIDEGCGAEFLYHWKPNCDALKEDFDNYVAEASKGKHESDDVGSADCVVARLVDEYETAKKFERTIKRVTKKGIFAFALNTDGAFTYRELRTGDRAYGTKYLDNKYGAGNWKFFN